MNNSLKKLKRRELLEILLEQTKRINELETELENANNELNERKVLFKKVGSLAEASLVLSNIFKAVDDTVNIYIKNVKELAKKELKELKSKEFEEIEKKCDMRLFEISKNELNMRETNDKKIRKKCDKKESKNDQK